MKKQKWFLALLITIVVIACQNSPEKKEAPYTPASYELTGTNLDTVNLTDTEGRRQGLWIPNKTNDLTDTVIYKNGEVINN